jgi:hypothetical protein
MSSTGWANPVLRKQAGVRHALRAEGISLSGQKE